ncbi:hypothetical protein FVP60_02360 [Microbacterium mitrae]|uniref:Uncharacterized protein n=1 Tax=Microbacterium mitrae TaxID=664640 RepID=A0A5C8HRS6_9MICO|nr:hypothetical protein [Microbacterium mitrae]TXK05848.1 hypothetical protein FVP60_02360 [Microbacterium mitrae]
MMHNVAASGGFGGPVPHPGSAALVPHPWFRGPGSAALVPQPSFRTGRSLLPRVGDIARGHAARRCLITLAPTLPTRGERLATSGGATPTRFHRSSHDDSLRQMSDAV